MKKNKYFEEIPPVMYQDILRSENKDKFTEKELRILKKELSDKGIQVQKILIAVNLESLIVSSSNMVEIIKIKDEWFFINKHPIYFKCDQFDGLIKCLKDEKIV